MAKSYAQIQSEIAKLQEQADKLREQEVGEVIARIKDAIKQYDLTPSQLGFRAARGTRAAAAPVAKKKGAAKPQFADGSGNVWSGRGPRPRWLKAALGKNGDIEQFRV